MTTYEHAQFLRMQPTCGTLAQAAASLMRRIYPRHTAKRWARDCDCPVDTARGYLSGRSIPVGVIERVAVRHGWPAVLAMFEPLLGPVPVDAIERRANAALIADVTAELAAGTAVIEEASRAAALRPRPGAQRVPPKPMRVGAR